MRHGFQPAMRAQLPVDPVQMIAERLRRDREITRDHSGSFARGEAAEDPALLLAQGLHGRMIGCVSGKRDDFAREIEHAGEQQLLALSPGDVARQANEQLTTRAPILEENRRDVHP